MCQRTALKFIPLLTPLRSQAPDRSYAPLSPVMSSTESPALSIDDDELCSDSESICSVVENASQHDDSLSSVSEVFSASEIALYSKRKEEGYDLKTDLRYNLWLLLRSGTPLPTEVSKLPYHSVASKIIGSIPPPIVKPKAMTPKSCARVITSNECRKEINEKEKRRVETLRLKEERKAERLKKQEEKKRLQEEKKRLQEEKKRLQEEKKNSKTFNHVSHLETL